jgi:hypothetical protein
VSNLLVSSFPLFHDRETRAGMPDLATFTWKMMQFEEFAYRRHLRFTPSDDPGAVRNRYADSFVTGGNGPSTVVVGTHYIPSPNIPSHRLVARFYCTFSVTNWTGYIEVTSSRGTVTQIVADSAGLGDRWINAFVPASGPDVLTVRVRCTNVGQGGFTGGMAVLSTCMWWEPLASDGAGLTVETSWSAMKFAIAHDGAPDSAFLLRWLARRANQFAGRRSVRMAVAVARRCTIGTAPITRRYKVWIGDVTAQIYISVEARCRTVNGDVTFHVDGSLVHTETLTPAVATQDVSTTVSITPGEHEIWVQQSAPLDTFTVRISEAIPNSANLGLVTGDIIPTLFRRLPIEHAHARAIIYGDKDSDARNVGRRALVENMTWLFAKRCRTLVHDASAWTSANYIGPDVYQPTSGTQDAAEASAGIVSDWARRKLQPTSEGNPGDQVVFRHYVAGYQDDNPAASVGQWRLALATATAVLAGGELPKVEPVYPGGEPPLPWSIIDLPYTVDVGYGKVFWRITHREDNSSGGAAGTVVPVRPAGWCIEEVSIGERPVTAWPTSHPKYTLPPAV